MNRAVTFRRTTFGLLAAGAMCAMLSLPAAGADPEDPAEPTTPAAPATPVASAPDDCNAAGLATTISSVTASLST